MNPLDPDSLPLRDIHLPDPIGWWPPAPGWWLLALTALVLAVLAALRWRRGRIRRLALRRVERVIHALGAGANPLGCIQDTAQILRRYCMTVAPDPAAVAGLAGASWLRYLDSCWPRDGFERGPGRLLIEAPYAPDARVDDAKALAELALDWLRAQTRRSAGGAPCGN
jgi:hypothetical protein